MKRNAAISRMGAAAPSVAKDRRTTDPWVRRERAPDQTVRFERLSMASVREALLRRALRNLLRFRCVLIPHPRFVRAGGSQRPRRRRSRWASGPLPRLGGRLRVLGVRGRARPCAAAILLCGEAACSRVRFSSVLLKVLEARYVAELLHQVLLFGHALLNHLVVSLASLSLMLHSE